MSVIRRSQSLYPFWGAGIKTITGLDPLSMQTTSEATYSMLLPGISNLTNRIRYYGFYCWLLKLYFDKETHGNSIEQFRFIRRAELMIALIMQDGYPKVNQITGSRFAANWLNEPWEAFDLIKGADLVNGSDKVYWKHKSGAFGQYYLGPMKVLDLITVGADKANDELFNITESNLQRRVSGRHLAEVFDSTLTNEVRILFYQNINRGNLNRFDIPLLAKYFAINKVDPFDEEGELYTLMINQQDYPSQIIEETITFHRRETLKGLIKIAIERDNQFNTQAFIETCYCQQFGVNGQIATDTELGWYTYQLNEYWQYACGCILWAMLNYLEKLNGPQYLPQFINSFVIKIMTQMNYDINTEGTLKKTLAHFEFEWNEGEYVKEIKASVDRNEDILAAASGFYLIFQIFTNNSIYTKEIRAYICRLKTIRDGNMVEGFEYIIKAFERPFNVFIEQFIYRFVVNRHRLVAMRKMGNGDLSTHKFIIDEQYISYIENFIPHFTSPRMYTVVNLFSDLNFLEIKENKLLLSGLHELLNFE
ncbi:hypothetical protein GVN20_06910 [Runella sp. CRIBMP]|uniref:hypothetical protein n=1 Tax=Runella sp. CRIBMP TaxID=2683261 RepID=UPI0014133E50|nr:hypothetical protein [Runella sp. CRIBMP]NBB19078.1 hypothetical protein [Runella sp. CRIBMP]